jgi:hypothetical protein
VPTLVSEDSFARAQELLQGNVLARTAGENWAVRCATMPGSCARDLLDQIVWAEVIRLLEDSTLIQQELDRRLAAARCSDPTKQREPSLRRELTRVGKSMERLLPPIRKNSCRWSSCVSECHRCANANKRCAPSCQRSLIKPAIPPPSCAWQRPSRPSWVESAAPLNLPRLRRRPRPVVAHRLPAGPPAPLPAKATFCVRG